MLLKPGWIIFLAMTWLVIQFLITVGDTANSLSTMSQAPIINILTTLQSVGSGGTISADWGSVLPNLWEMLTFKTNFLTGSWGLISVILACIYGGVGLSILFTLASAALNAISSLLRR
jgi:hypothetical protein